MNELFEFSEPEQLDHLLSTFPLIDKISGKYQSLKVIERSEDISQEVKLGLLTWKRNHQEKILTLDEWLKIANRATHNEIKNFYRRKTPETVSLSELQREALCPLSTAQLTTQTEGNTTMELNLLVTRMWEIVKTQTFFENCSLLLKNGELTSSLIYYRGCRIRELAERLHLTETEFEAIIEKLPLSDNEIVALLNERFEMKATPAAIRKARQRATDQLRSAVSGKPEKKKQSDGKTSGDGKT